MPSLPVPGRWRGFPVTPALVTWRMESARGRVVAGPRVARDVRRTVPRNDRFWRTYARGTHQNFPVFDGSKHQGVKGRYLFRLAGAQRAPGDVLVVTASDIAGNSGVRRLALDAL
jgi:hypothetical protein